MSDIGGGSNESEKSDSELSDKSDSDKSQIKSKAPPFSIVEKNLLLGFIEDNKSTIESKYTDFASINAKQACWKKIADKFNSQKNVNKKSSKQLKAYWTNCKKRAKKDACGRKKKLRKTGGGKAVTPLKPETERVALIVPSQMESLSNVFDGDADIEILEKINKEVDQNDAPEVKPETTSAPVIKKRTTKDSRSSLIDQEYEEHKIRMMTLKVEYETALVKKEIEEKRLEFIVEEHQLKKGNLNNDSDSDPFNLK